MGRTYGKKVRHMRKLYKKRKSKFRIGLEITLTILVAGSLCVVGYAAGKPLIEFFRGEEETLTVDESDVSESITTPTITATNPESSPPKTEQTTTAPETPQKPVEIGNAFAPNSTLQNASALSAYAAKIKSEGYTSVVVELKDSVGNIWYKTGLEILKDCNFIKGGLSIEQIISVFKSLEIEVIARINTLSDQTAPIIIADMSYRFADNSYQWLDNTPENGGKRWANPFLSGTKIYISDIVKEISSQGITNIILANNIFPRMTAYDISVLPSQVTDMNTRYQGLVDLYKECYNKKADSQLLIEISILDAVENFSGFSSSAEILKGKSQLQDAGIVITMNRADIGSELKTGNSSSVLLPTEAPLLITTLYKQAARNVGLNRIIPCINAVDYTEQELEAVIQAFKDMGYLEYIVR